MPTFGKHIVETGNISDTYTYFHVKSTRQKSFFPIHYVKKVSCLIRIFFWQEIHRFGNTEKCKSTSWYRRRPNDVFHLPIPLMPINSSLLFSIEGAPFSERSRLLSTLCGHFRFLLSLRFYVKLMLKNVKVPKLPFFQFLRLWLLLIWKISSFGKCKNV